MANPVTFANDYFAQVANLINVLEDLRTLNDRLTQNSSLVTDYFANPVHRTDITATDFNNAKGAVTQILFTFDSGSPTQKSYLFNLL